MRSKTSQWFVTKLRYEKMHEDGLIKKVTETYCFEALTFTEAEARLTEEASKLSSGEFSIEDISKAQFKEVFFSDREEDDRWYSAKLAFISFDENTGKEKRSNVTYLVQAKTLNGAVRNIDEVMNGTLVDYSSLSVTETNYMDVYEYVKHD